MSWSERLGVMFRPDRLKYIKRAIKGDETEECVFCEGLKKGSSLESLLIHEDENTLVFVNKFPYNNGHILVLPKRHEGDILKLSDAEYEALHAQLRNSIAITQKVFEPHAINVGMNLGRSAGAGIPGHLHYHIVPRWNGDANFFPVIAGAKVIAMTLEDVYNALKDHY